ncbi:MAG: hypothetical protein AAGA57_03425 [Planctomycetota bacterium]
MKTARRAKQVVTRVKLAVRRRVPARVAPDAQTAPVLVWGADACSDRVVRCLNHTGRKPVALIDPGLADHATASRGGLPILPPQRAADRLAKLPHDDADKHLLINGPEAGADKPFQAIYDRVRACQAQPPLGRFPLRYASTLDQGEPFTSERIFINGFPGSGNMLLQRAFELIRELAPEPPMPEREQLLGQFAWEYSKAVAAHLDAPTVERFPQARRKTLAIASQYGSRYHFFDKETERTDRLAERCQALMFGLPIPTALWGATHSTHEPLTPPVLDYFQHRGFRTALIVRHPLDVLISNAAKLTAGPQGRDPLALLDHPGWLESMLRPLTAYFRHYADLRHRVTLFRYEEALQCPAVFVRRAAEMMGLELDDDRVDNLWAKIDGKPVSKLGKGHFWRPGAGKYAEFMQARHIDALRASGLVDAAHALDYPIDFEAIANDTQPTDREPRDLSGPRYSLADHRYHGVMGKPVVFPHPDIHHREDARFEIGCNDPDMFAALCHQLDDPALQAVFDLLPDPPGLGRRVAAMCEP